MTMPITQAAFHVSDGWFFERVGDDGSVKINAAVGQSAETITLTMTAAEWASVIAAVSAQGETAETYQAASNLHAPTKEV